MKNVLLATDGSSNAEDGARFLAHLPHVGKLELTVLTVLETPYVNFRYPTSDWIQDCIELEKAKAVETFHKIEALFEGANVTLKHLIRDGNRQTTVVDVAKEIKAHLVVVGARGHSTVSRILLGSISDYVATHAHCSVLVVRPTQNRIAGHPLRIVIGYEDAGPARAALEEFAEIGWGPHTDVRVVTVISYLAGALFRTVFEGPEKMKAAKDTADEAAASIREKMPEAIAAVIENEHAGEGLVSFVEDHETDLVVVGATARGALGQVLLGSVSRFVLRYAPCSVWITRNRFVQGIMTRESQQETTSV